MQHEKFINFLQKLEIKDGLLEAILEGYAATFAESLNAWAYNTPPTPTGINMPMGSYDNIMKQLPSSIGAVGGSGDATRAGGQNYQYNVSLPGPTRDIGEETKTDWETAPKFKKIKTNTIPLAQRLIKMAQKHIPTEGNNLFTPMNYYNNFPMGNSMGRFDVTSSNMPPF